MKTTITVTVSYTNCGSSVREQHTEQINVKLHLKSIEFIYLTKWTV